MSICLASLTFAAKPKKTKKYITKTVVTNKKIKKRYNKKNKIKKQTSGALLVGSKTNKTTQGISSDVVKFAPINGFAGNVGLKYTYRGETAKYPDSDAVSSITLSYGIGNNLVFLVNGKHSFKTAYQDDSDQLGHAIQKQEPNAFRDKYGFGLQDTIEAFQLGLGVSYLNNSAKRNYNEDNMNGIAVGYEINPYLQMKIDKDDTLFINGVSRTLNPTKGSFNGSYNNGFGINNNNKGQLWRLAARYNHVLTNKMLIGSYFRFQITNKNYTYLQSLTNANEDDMNDQIDVKPMIFSYEIQKSNSQKTTFTIYPELKFNNFRKCNIVHYPKGDSQIGYYASVALVPQIEHDISFGHLNLFLIGQLKLRNTYISFDSYKYASVPNQISKKMYWEGKAVLGMDYSF